MSQVCSIELDGTEKELWQNVTLQDPNHLEMTSEFPHKGKIAENFVAEEDTLSKNVAACF